MLDNLGLEVPTQDQGQPPIIWHDPSTYFPGETLVRAMHAGANFFRAKPEIIFVLLPDIGESSIPPLYPADMPAIMIAPEVPCCAKTLHALLNLMTTCMRAICRRGLFRC